MRHAPLDLDLYQACNYRNQPLDTACMLLVELCTGVCAVRKAALVNIQDYLQIKAAAGFLGVSVNTMRNWERTGKLATYRHPINGYRLYKKSDLEALLAAIQRSDLPAPIEP